MLVAQGAFLVMAVTAAAAPASRQEATDDTRARGLRPGPHAVGFEVIGREDRTRRINHTDAGTWVGLAVWYPARRTTERRPAMTAMDFIVTADTRKGLDLFDDFAAMRFSDRTEVTLESAGLRHHDLSDIGRAAAAIDQCRDRLERLSKTPLPR